MKPFSFFLLLTLAAITSCNKFIDVVQDNRTLIDSEDKVAKLLVNAYPDAQYSEFAESMSDNADDKGTADVSGNAAIINMDAYRWIDYESLTDLDAPSNFWNSSYTAVAQANQALTSLDKLGIRTANTSSLRGEALLARAYAHFMLVNLFALRYDPATASTALGIPYVTATEQHAIVQYQRETMAETYRLIEKDLMEGLPLIGNDIDKPKFHFSPQSAHAFAARFYLYKGEWDKVVEHASLVLGEMPALVIRDLVSDSYKQLTVDQKRVGYSASTERANLLIAWTESLVGHYYIDYRFGLSANKMKELFNNDSNPFGKKWAYDIYGTDPYYNNPKYTDFFKITNMSAGIGHTYVSFVHFTTDEALLNRAEAYAMLNKFDQAANDLTDFLSLKTTNVVARNKITLQLMNRVYPVVENEYTPFYALSSDQAAFVKGIAEFRRREFYHEGLRWFDVKRFNLVVTHKQKKLPTLSLPKDDPRRAIQIPEAAKAFGIEPNKR